MSHRPKGLKYKIKVKNKSWFTPERSNGNKNAKGNKPNKTSFKKGRHYNIKTEFKKGQTRKEKNINWKGGISHGYRVKNAPRKKPKYCEICGESGQICCDHDHKTGKFRGWICSRCNFAIGHAKDSIKILNKLIQYIKKNSYGK
jgi:hypothetical protein